MPVPFLPPFPSFLPPFPHNQVHSSPAHPTNPPPPPQNKCSSPPPPPTPTP
jgi:hypothetical protein